MIRRSTVTAIARALNGLFFLTTAAYCILSYSSFAYHQFIRPEVFDWPGDFVVLHHLLYWLSFLVTALTLMPYVRSPHSLSAWAARLYLAASAVVGVWLVLNPFMTTVGLGFRSLVAGLVTLLFPLALAVVDHIVARPVTVGPVSEARLFRACAFSAGSVWAAYAIAAPYRLRLASGIELPSTAVAMGLAGSALAHVMVFTVLFLLLVLLLGLGRACGFRPKSEYWLIMLAFAATCALALYELAFRSIGFSGSAAWTAALALGVSISSGWSGVANHRAADRGTVLDSIDLALSPIYLRPRLVRQVGMALLPVLAFSLANAVERFDWDFLLQKLSVLIVWVVAFSLMYDLAGSGDSAVARGDRPTWANRPLIVSAAVLAVYWVVALPASTVMAKRGDARLNPEFVLDRYAAVDPSLHLIQDVTRANSGAAADFYSFLKANTTIAHVNVDPVDVDFVKPLGPPPGERPHIFFFVIDSLRRDYLSPYNKAVTFTPAIDAFARDSAVFDRAFTRYGATGLSVPAMWIGGMTLHMQYIRPFVPMNTLHKLLDAGGYRRIMGIDSIARRILPAMPMLTELDKGRPTMHYDFCETMGELREKLDESGSDPRPIFGYTLPQNIHIAISFQTPVPAGESYPGFFEKVAAQVHRVDRCFGGFIEHLKKRKLYDNSIIILTSDHGDSLGEEGRWGHSYTVFPEVMRVPLIVHLPTSMAESAPAHLSRLAFTTDITPSLYALLGYQPAELGPLYGTPLFGRTPAEEARRRDSFLLASSYGAVYGMLRHNGRSLYIADAVEGRDYAYDLSQDGLDKRIEVTQAMRELNGGLIRADVSKIAGQYNFNPKP